MKKAVLLLVYLFLLAVVGGCGGHQDSEKEAYRAAVDALVAALDAKDGEALYDLFSPAVQAKDEDLRQQVEHLLTVYEGPADAVGWDGLLGSDGMYENGRCAFNAYTTFPIRAGDTYYWFYMDLMYKNTFNRAQVGITQLVFYTAAEYCGIFYDDDAQQTEETGLTVHAEQTVAEEIRCIYGKPHKYDSRTSPLELAQVKAFCEGLTDFAAFKERFGEPNAANIWSYYALVGEGEKPRYLQLAVHEGKIHSAEIVDDFDFVETVFDID